jgi:hypothetical protein
MCIDEALFRTLETPFRATRPGVELCRHHRVSSPIEESFSAVVNSLENNLLLNYDPNATPDGALQQSGEPQSSCGLIALESIRTGGEVSDSRFGTISFPSTTYQDRQRREEAALERRSEARGACQGCGYSGGEKYQRTLYGSSKKTMRLLTFFQFISAGKVS